MKKPIYKKWWFWVIIGVVVIAIIGGSADESDGTAEDNANNANTGNAVTTARDSAEKNPSSTEKNYEKVDLQTLLDELEENALRAESKYQNAYIEITGKIKVIDSDGAYITIEPVYADEWNFNTVMCYIKSSAQKDFIIEKSVGDTVTVKGKVFSIGEVIDYSINMDSIS